jgi:hypothetical protein
MDDYELIAQKLSGIDEKVSGLENRMSDVLTRMADIERVQVAEDAALNTARALAEIAVIGMRSMRPCVARALVKMAPD